MNLQDYLKTTSQSALARKMGVTQGLIWQLATGYTKISAERAVKIEKATNGKVSRAELRPDIFIYHPD